MIVAVGVVVGDDSIAGEVVGDGEVENDVVAEPAFGGATVDDGVQPAAATAINKTAVLDVLLVLIVTGSVLN